MIMEDMNEELSENVKQYYSILRRYRHGEFGEDYLTLYEILVKANDETLLERLTKEEVDYLIEHSSGFVRLMFSDLKEKRFGDNMTLSLNKEF